MISAVTFQTSASYSPEFIMSQFDNLAKVEHIIIQQFIDYSDDDVPYEQLQHVLIFINQWHDTELAYSVIRRLKSNGYAYIDFFCSNTNSIQAFCLLKAGHDTAKNFDHPRAQAFCVNYYDDIEAQTTAIDIQEHHLDTAQDQDPTEDQDTAEDLDQDPEIDSQQALQDQEDFDQDTEDQDSDYDAWVDQQIDHEYDDEFYRQLQLKYDLLYDQFEQNDYGTESDNEFSEQAFDSVFDFDHDRPNPAGIKARIRFLKDASNKLPHQASTFHRDIVYLRSLLY